jgi:RHS repeat-associated protein
MIKIQPMSIRIVFAVLSFVLLAFNSKAVILPYSKGLLTTPTFMGGSPIVAGTASATMSAYITPPTTGLSYTDVTKRGAITLGVDHHYSVWMSTSVTEIIVKVTRYPTLSGAAITDTNIVLRVSYYPNDSLSFDDKHTVTFGQAEKFTAVITSIKVNSVTQTNLPINLYLQGDVFVDRIYNFTSQATVTPTFVSAATTQDLDCDSKLDQITISWNPIIGAEEYQLEWFFINNLDKAASDLKINFKLNSTRISTSSTSYSIALVFDKGYICYRVRAVGRSNNATFQDRFIFTKWTTADGDMLVSDLPATSRYLVAVPFEISKNWQYTTTYAEEGKKKEVISFFDGSLRNRQMVTKVNSDKNAIVGETIYDHIGRGAVQVLPTPVIDPTSCTTPDKQAPLRYYPNYNKNLSNVAYSKADFDISGSDSCNTVLSGMNTNSGSSNYYSNSNPDLVGAQAYLPDAEKFPFSQTQYMPDNTGRIRSQGGVGKDFQLGTGHETKYFYAHPFQEQLDRLFGSEVGDATHYQKNMVVAPNDSVSAINGATPNSGQVSVSYLDQEGRVVATSLAGRSPSSLLPLPSATAATPITVDLFAKDKDGNSKSNNLSLEGKSKEFNQTIALTSPTNLSIAYNMTVPPFQDNCLSDDVCFNCVYDLQIEVRNICGQLLSPVAISSRKTGRFNLDPVTHAPNFTLLDCGVLNFDTAFTIYSLPVGTYQISKILTVNDEAIQDYLDLYLDTSVTRINHCLDKYEEILEDVTENSDITNCGDDDYNCAECVAKLGSLQAYLEAGGTQLAYQKELDDCNAPCRMISYYETMRMQLRTDVSPGGQYGEYMNNQGVTASGSFPLSVFNENNSLPKSPDAHWRKPQYDIESTIQNFYFEEDGITKSRVYLDNVTVASNIITQSVPALNPLNTYTVGVNAFLDPALNRYYVYPQDLADVKDFITLYMGNPHWSNSLVIYHPEYPILKTYREFTVPVNEGENYTSESFDAAMMNINTWADAVTAGFIDPNWASLPVNSRIMNYFAVSSAHPWDPFATHINSIGMQNKLYANMSVSSTSYSMMEVAAMMTRCQTPYIGSAPSTACKSWGDNYGSDPTAIRNAEWLAFRGLYMAAKQELQQNLARYRSLTDPDYFGYNGCIGNEDYMPFTYGFAYIDFTAYPFLSGQILNDEQPCYFLNAQKYLHKEKRFGNPLEYVDNDPSQAAYQTYLATGQCPIAFSFEKLLSEVADMGLLSSPGFSMDVLPTVTSLVMTMNNFAPPTSPIPSLTWAPVAGPSTELEVNWNQGVTPFGSFHLVKASGSLTYNWSDIQYFQNIHYTATSGSYYEFSIEAKVLIGGVLKTQYLTGNTTLEIGGCTFSEVCKLNAIGKDLEKMLQTTAYMHTFSSTTPVDLTNPPYATFLSNTLLYAINPASSGTTTWRYVASPPSFEFTNGSSTLTLGINNVSPSNFNLASIGTLVSVEKIKPGYNNTFEIVCKNAGGYEIRLICDAVRTGNTAILLSECGMPEPELCKGVEYDTKKDLFNVLKLVLETQNAPFNLAGNTSWTPTLNSQVMGYPSNITGTASAVSGKKLLTFTIPGGCNLVLTSINLENPVFDFNNIISVDSMKLMLPENGYSSYYDFRLKVTYTYSGVNYQRYLYGTSCFKMKECSTCTQVQTGIPGLPVANFPEESGPYTPLINTQDYTEILCPDLYEDYVAAYDNFVLRQQQNPNCTSYLTLFPKLTYQQFLDGRYCCKAGNTLKMIDRIISLSTTTECPIIGDTVASCVDPINTGLGSYFCSAIESRFHTTIDAFNASPWAVYNGVSFSHDLPASMCRCTRDYILYLLEYITASAAEPLAIPDNIGVFCEGKQNTVGVIENPPNPPHTGCQEKYDQYLAFVTDYNNYASDYWGTEYQVPVVSYTDYSNYGLCSCSDEYISILNMMLDGAAPLTEFTGLLNFCESKEVLIPCIPTHTLTHFDSFEITYDDPCTEFYESNNETNAYITYNQQMQDFQTDITQRYIAHCMKAVENMNATYNEAEYHFTLYYYDQAGNLVKTVPPEGVEFVDISNSVIRDSIKSDRKYGRQSVITNHRLATTYLYNSLNQLVGQNMPDQDPMQIVESYLPNGLPIGFNTTAIQMLNSNLGYMTGAITNTGVPMGSRGYTFTTTNGGQNWTRITNTLAANLKEIKMVSATQGFAIAQNGLFFITNDAGLTWDLINTYTSGYIADFVALDASATDIYVLAKTGLICKYPIAGAINAAISTYISIPPLPSGYTAVEYKDFVLPASIVANGTGVVYAVTVTNGTETFDVVSLNTSGTSTFEYIQVADLNALSFYSATEGVIGGQDGNISTLKGAAGSYTQLMHTSGTLATINQLIMLNANIGLACVTENSNTTIRKTTDGGTTWALLDSGFEGAQLALNKRTATTMEVLVQGKEIINTVAYSYSKTVFLNASGTVSILEQTPNVHQPLDMKVVSSYTDGAGNTFYFGIDALTNKLYRSNSFTTMGSQVVYGPANPSPGTAPTLSGGIVPKQLVAVKCGLGVSIYVLSTAGTVYRSYAATPGGNYSAFTVLGGPSTMVALDQMASGGLNYLVGYNTSDNKIYYAESAIGTSFNYFSTTLPLASAVITNIAAHGNQLSVIGTKGAILTSGVISSFPTSSGSSLTFVARPSHGLTRLTGIKKLGSELVIFGENGLVLTRSTSGTMTTCVVKPLGTLEQVNSAAVYTNSSDNYYLFAGNNGYLTAFDNSTWAVQPPLFTTMNMSVSDYSSGDALRDIAVSASSIYVVGDNGRAYYSPTLSINSATLIPINTPSGDHLNSVAIINNIANKAIAVGNNTTVTRFNSNFATKGNQVFGPNVADIHFANDQIGTIVGSHFFVRSTTDGGATWKVNMPATFVTGDIYSLKKVWTRVSPVGDHYAIIGGSAFLGTANGGVITKQVFTGNISDIQFQKSTPSNGYVSYGTTLRKLTLTPFPVSAPTTYTCALSGTNTTTTTASIIAMHVFENQSVMMVALSGNIYYYRPSNGSLANWTVASTTFTDIYFHDNTNGYAVGLAGKFLLLKATSLHPINREIQALAAPTAQVLNDPSIGTNTSYNITCIAFGSRINGVYGGGYTNSTYVTNNPAMVRLLKHEGGLYSSRFHYDRLGRIVASQNSRQLGSSTTTTDDKYSYTLYDALGRVTEGGEKSENSSGVQFKSIFGTNVGGSYVSSVVDDTKLVAWLTNLATTTRKEVTKSYYDKTNAAISTEVTTLAMNTATQRKRIVHVTYSSVYSPNANEYDHATHYNYDIHGNVKNLYQDNRLLQPYITIRPHRLKKIDYVYDLISGNVHRMDYQTGSTDQWHHVYDYDADNRVTSAFTSAQTPYTSINSSIASLQNEPLLSPFWDEEVQYRYYTHGRISRILLGDEQVQGIDYVYALQGWIKGVNSERLNPASDPGKDGTAFSSWTALDAYGYTLHYFNGDFKYVTTVSTANSFMGSQTSSDLVNTSNSRDLYSGNIARMITSITEPNTRVVLPLGNAYRYDQLNRLREARSFTNLNLTTNVWGSGGMAIYGNSFAYDANGNIKTQVRNDATGTIDILTYNYPLISGKVSQNRLLYVTDAMGDGVRADDIDSQLSGNYTYDAEGRLTGDVKEGTTFTWRADGKVATVTNTISGRKNLRFDYDAMGHRIAKHIMSLSNVLEKSVYYTLDAQGNTVSVYERAVDASQQTVTFTQVEKHIYGSDRIGVNNRQVPVLGAQYTFSMNGVRHQVGTRTYELKNHLGNVLSVISNKPIPHKNGTSVDYWLADIRQSTDYSPFGVQLSARNITKFMPGTSTPITNADGRYGYQGSEEDDEIKGEGNSYTTEYRFLDPRLGRWLSIDPVFQPHQGPYNSMDNNPIFYNDPLGDRVKITETGEKKRELRRMIREARKQDVGFDIWYKNTKRDNRTFYFRFSDNQANSPVSFTNPKYISTSTDDGDPTTPNIGNIVNINNQGVETGGVTGFDNSGNYYFTKLQKQESHVDRSRRANDIGVMNLHWDSQTNSYNTSIDAENGTLSYRGYVNPNEKTGNGVYACNISLSSNGVVLSNLNINLLQDQQNTNGIFFPRQNLNLAGLGRNAKVDISITFFNTTTGNFVDRSSWGINFRNRYFTTDRTWNFDVRRLFNRETLLNL